MASRFLLVLIFVSVIWAGCFGRPWRFQRQRKTTLATFNAALLPIYPELETRASILKEQIKQSRDVDIFCLQEVWYADIQRDVYDSVKEEFPYALSAIDLTASPNSSDPACPLQVLQQLGVCQVTNCPGITNSLQLLGCLVTNCESVLSTTSPECNSCLLINGDPIVCATALKSRYESTYGLMLLSRSELTDTRAEGFTADSHLKGLLQASVNGVGDILCTHLSPDFGSNFVGPPVVFPLKYQTYAEQHYAELLRVFDILVTMDFPILIGDVNHGPAAPGNITWELPLHYGLVNSRGFYSPYVIEDGRCTWCLDNLAAAANFPFNLIIDHIYIPTDSSERVEKVERFLDTITTPNGTPLSDHYGVKMTVRKFTRTCNWWQRWRYFCQSEREDLMSLPPPDQHLQNVCATQDRMMF